MTTDLLTWRDSVRWYTHETALVRLAKITAGWPFRIVARVECRGLEHLPTESGFILAPNHSSYYDIVYLALYLPRHPFFMAKRELFEGNPLVAWAYRIGGSFPIQRGLADKWALDHASKILGAGQMLTMFPEGTRNRGQLRKGKPGVVKLALDNQVPIVPAAIEGTAQFKWGPPNSVPIRLELAPPLDVTAMAGPPPHRADTLRHLTTDLMHRIAAMLPPNKRGPYA